MAEFYSQFGQDRAVRELFPDPDKQFRLCIDVGAGDGRTDSNTLHFRLSGWRSLLIEADPDMAAKIVEAQVVETVAIANVEGPMPFQKVPVPGWSGLTEFPHRLNEAEIARMWEACKVTEVLVPCVKLQRLLDKYELSTIDYLSLDIEGAELSALESIDWSRTRIYVITVEISRTDGAIGRFLMERGYCLWGKLGSDEVYVLKGWLLRGRR